MVVIAPAPPVAAPARTALSFGAFSVLSFRENLDRWVNGVSWETLTCEPAGVYGAPDCDATLVEGLPRSVEKLAAPLGSAVPFSVYGHHLCTPIGNSFEWAQEQARLHLAAREEAAVETAVQGIITSLGALAAGVTVPWEMLAALEQHFSETYGGQGIIWTSRRLATLMSDDGHLTVKGGRLTTILGTPVVAAAGVDDGFLGITGTPVGYRSDIDDLSARDFDLLDRGQNNLLTIAERTYLVGFEECGMAYANLTLPAVTFTPPTPEEPAE